MLSNAVRIHNDLVVDTIRWATITVTKPNPQIKVILNTAQKGQQQ